MDGGLCLRAPDWNVDRVLKLLTELERVGLLERRTDGDGRVWGHWVVPINPETGEPEFEQSPERMATAHYKKGRRDLFPRQRRATLRNTVQHRVALRNTVRCERHCGTRTWIRCWCWFWNWIWIWIWIRRRPRFRKRTNPKAQTQANGGSFFKSNTNTAEPEKTGALARGLRLREA